jgi:hypothetical protein
MICRFCKNKYVGLTRVRPSFCPTCGKNHWQIHPKRRGQARLYDISPLAPGEALILPWDLDKMMYTVEKSQVMRLCVTRQAAKLGWTIDIIRHIAGLKVTRLT